MFSGWIRKWPVNRPIREHEKEAALSRTKSPTIELDPTSVVAYNSTYMEVVDRAYRQRGGWYTMVCLLIAIALFFLSVWGLIYSIIHSDDLYHIILVNTVMILMVIAL